MLRLKKKNRNTEADQSSVENASDRTPPYTSNVTSAPSHNLPGRDSVRQPEYTLTDTTAPSHTLPGRGSVWQPNYTTGVAEASQVLVATPNYIYYRIYAEDGAIPSKTPVAAADPFLGRIRTISVPPPRTLKAVEGSIAEVENIKHFNTTIFFTPYSQSPLSDAERVSVLPGSTPQEPLALVAKMSDPERSALESERRGGLVSAAEPNTTSPEIQYLYYLLYGINYEIPSKVPIDSKTPSLGRIRADSVAPPRSLTSFKQCISRVERNPNFCWHADFFADSSCNTPLEGSHISIPGGPGRSPNEPMIIILRPSIPDGRYVIRNRAVNRDSLFNGGSKNYWHAWYKPIRVHFFLTTMVLAKRNNFMQWDITNDNNGNISITSPYSPSLWVGADMTGSTGPVPWRLILADSKIPSDIKSYYLTTDMNCIYLNPRVPTLTALNHKSKYDRGEMAILKEGDQKQMWEFIRI